MRYLYALMLIEHSSIKGTREAFPSLSSYVGMLYKAIPVQLAGSGNITMRSSRSCGLSAVTGPLMYRRREAENVEGVFERHAIKAVTALAIFVEDRPHRIKRVHAVGNLGKVILAVIEIHTSSTGKRLPKRLVVQVQGNGSPLELLWCHVTSSPFA